MQLDVCAIRLTPKTFNVEFRYSLDGEPIAPSRSELYKSSHP
jgi:hypothetical protein